MSLTRTLLLLDTISKQFIIAERRSRRRHHHLPRWKKASSIKHQASKWRDLERFSIYLQIKKNICAFTFRHFNFTSTNRNPLCTSFQGSAFHHLFSPFLTILVLSPGHLLQTFKMKFTLLCGDAGLSYICRPCYLHWKSLQTAKTKWNKRRDPIRIGLGGNGKSVAIHLRSEVSLALTG